MTDHIEATEAESTLDVSGSDSFPRQYARTRRLTLGDPRNIVVSPDGHRIVFIRSRSGDDPVNCLYLLDVATGEERLIADPLTLLLQDDPDDLPIEEQRSPRTDARDGLWRHDVRHGFGRHGRRVPTAGRLFVAGLISGVARELDVDGPSSTRDPILRPTGWRT